MIPEQMQLLCIMMLIMQFIHRHCRKVKPILMKNTFLFEDDLDIEVLHTPNLIQPGFEPMTSRSWQYISCPCNAHPNHSGIKDAL